MPSRQRYIFRVTPPATALLAITGALAFPPDAHPRAGERRPALDVPGAALGTSGMILLTFALSSSDTYGWTKALVLAPLVISIAVLGGFVWTEKKVRPDFSELGLLRGWGPDGLCVGAEPDYADAFVEAAELCGDVVGRISAVLLVRPLWSGARRGCY